MNNLFNNKPNNDLYSPIYISNDDVLFIKRTKYYEQKQLSINESEEAIKALLLTQLIWRVSMNLPIKNYYRLIVV